MALQDLQQIKAYIANELCNSDAAAHILKEILDACQRLKGMPLIGKKLSAAIEIESDFRYCICANYLIFYKADSEYVSVYRVLYGKRDYVRILFGEQMDASTED